MSAQLLLYGGIRSAGCQVVGQTYEVQTYEVQTYEVPGCWPVVESRRSRNH